MILEAIFGDSQNVNDPYHWIARGRWGGKSTAGVWINETEALKFSAVMGCVQILARTVAQLPLHVYTRDGEVSKIAREHPVDWMISREPNEMMTSFIWRELSQQHVTLWGDTYAEIERDGRFRPIAIHPLLPDRTTPKINEDTGRLVYEGRYSNGEPFRLNWENVLHIPGLGFDGLKGYSVIANARNSIGLAAAAEEFGAKFFSEGARSAGFLQHPNKVSATAKENIESSFREKVAGLDNAHKTTILEEGMKWVATTIPPDDAQFLQTRQHQVEDIARWFNIPLFMLQAHNKDTSWGSGVEQQLIAFLVINMDSWFRRWEQELDRKLFSQSERRQFFTKFNVAALLRADLKTQMEFLRGLVGGSIYTPNEARMKLDLGPQEGGDRLLIPKNYRFINEPDGDALPGTEVVQ